MSAVCSQSLRRASNTSKSVLLISMVLLMVPVFEVVTAPLGSSSQFPSTQNLYWCSPSGRSTMATKLLRLLLRGILVFQLLKEPDTKTSLAEPFQVNTVGRPSL